MYFYVSSRWRMCVLKQWWPRCIWWLCGRVGHNCNTCLLLAGRRVPNDRYCYIFERKRERENSLDGILIGNPVAKQTGLSIFTCNTLGCLHAFPFHDSSPIPDSHGKYDLACHSCSKCVHRPTHSGDNHVPNGRLLCTCSMPCLSLSGNPVANGLSLHNCSNCLQEEKGPNKE